MQKQNNNVMDIDERPKGRKGIEEMLQRISEIDDSPSPQEKDEKIRAFPRKCGLNSLRSAG